MSIKVIKKGKNSKGRTVKIECAICFENYNIKKYYKCSHCDILVCKKCLLEYTVEHSNLSRLRCVGCKVIIPYSMYREIFRVLDVNKLKRYMRKVLVAEAEAFLPIVQKKMLITRQITEEKTAIADIEANLDKAAHRVRKLELQMSSLNRHVDPDGSEIRKLDMKRLHIVLHADKLDKELDTHYEKLIELRDALVDKEKKKNANIPQTKCPSDDCRGYLDESFTCALCEQLFCKKCYKMVENKKRIKHKCDKDDVKSVKLIMEETKPCPKCGTRIQKTIGCNQMWCVKCYTGFMYDTLEIITKEFHNPHRQEWLERNRSLNMLYGCGENLEEVIPHKYIPETWILNNYLMVALHVYGSIDQIEEYVNRMRDPEYNTHEMHDELDMKYLDGTISKKQWGKELFYFESLFEYAVSCFQLRTMYRDCTRDILMNYVTWCQKHNLYESNVVVDPNNRILAIITGIEPSSSKLKRRHRKKFMDTLEELERLREYYNQEELKLANKYEDLWDDDKVDKYLIVDFHDTTEIEREMSDLPIRDLYLTVYASLDSVDSVDQYIMSLLIQTSNRNSDIPNNFAPSYHHYINPEVTYSSVEDWKRRNAEEHNRMSEYVGLLQLLPNN